MKDTRCLQSQICDEGTSVPIKSKQTLPKPGGGTLGSEPGFPPVGGILTTLSEAPNFMILQRLDSSEVDGLLPNYSSLIEIIREQSTRSSKYVRPPTLAEKIGTKHCKHL